MTASFNPKRYLHQGRMENAMEARTFTYLSGDVTISRNYGANKEKIDFYSGYLFGKSYTREENYWFTWLYDGNYYD